MSKGLARLDLLRRDPEPALDGRTARMLEVLFEGNSREVSHAAIRKAVQVRASGAAEVEDAVWTQAPKHRLKLWLAAQHGLEAHVDKILCATPGGYRLDQQALVEVRPDLAVAAPKRPGVPGLFAAPVEPMQVPALIAILGYDSCVFVDGCRDQIARFLAAGASVQIHVELAALDHAARLARSWGLPAPTFVVRKNHTGLGCWGLRQGWLARQKEAFTIDLGRPGLRGPAPDPVAKRWTKYGRVAEEIERLRGLWMLPEARTTGRFVISDDFADAAVDGVVRQIQRLLPSAPPGKKPQSVPVPVAKDGLGSTKVAE